MSQSQPVDLSVNVGSIRFSNPIIAASGTFGYGVEFAGQTNLNRLGGIVVKGLSLEPMEGAPGPRLAPTPSGMINAVGLQNIGVQRFIAEKLPALRSYRTPIIANVFGRTILEYCEVIRRLEDADGLTGYELNISCPNTERGGAQFGSNAQMAAEVVAAAKSAAVRRPLWVKLSPILPDITPVAKAVEDAGADVLTVANTYPAMAVDFRSRKSRVGNPTGGLSGKAIKPITVRLVYQAAQGVKIPVIGLGGIDSPEDVVEYLLVGASAVQVGTANFVNSRACELLVDRLERFCMELKYHNISTLKSSFEAENG